jgi:uncharacterized membrane protein
MTTMSLCGLILSSALFSAKVFWPYFSSVVFLFIGLAFIPGNKWVRSRGIEKALALAPLFIAVPLGAFGTDHFVEHTSIARIVPAWMPAHLFWVYFVGVALIAAALSIAANKYVKLSATLLGLMFFLFVLLMHIPTLAAHPKNRFASAYVLRDSFFSAGAIALSRAHREDFAAGLSDRLVTVSRFVIGIVAAVYGVEHFMYPHFVPVLPLEQPLPSWLPMQLVVAYVTGSILFITGVSLLVNRKARLAATVLGIASLAVVIIVYLPLLVARPLDLEALNYFLDTLLFSGCALALAGALPKDEQALLSAAAGTPPQ